MVKSRANLSRPVVVAARWVNQREIMLGFEAVQERSLPDAWNQLDLSVGSARYLTANGANDSVFPVFPSLAFLVLRPRAVHNGGATRPLAVSR